MDIDRWEGEGGARQELPAAPAEAKRARRGGAVIPIDRRRPASDGIHPSPGRIVVRRIEEQAPVSGGRGLPHPGRETPQQGEVIALARGGESEDHGPADLGIRVGSRILFAAYAGTETKLHGTQYITMREDDVLQVLDSPGSEVI